MTIFSTIILILIIINGLHCIILAWVLKNHLMQLGKEEYYFSSILHIFELYERAKSNNSLDKYKKFIYYVVIACVSELALFITLIVYYI